MDRLSSRSGEKKSVARGALGSSSRGGGGVVGENYLWGVGAISGGGGGVGTRRISFVSSCLPLTHGTKRDFQVGPVIVLTRTIVRSN